MTDAPIGAPREPGLTLSDVAPRGFRDAMGRLGSAQKPGHGVAAYTRYVNRRLGRPLAAGSYVLGLTPNTVTVISGVVSLVGIVALAVVEPSLALAIGVAAALLFGYALDSADGQLARLRGGGSLAGEWLDHVVDAVRLPALHAAVLIGLYRFADDLPEWYLLVPLAYLVVSTVRYFANMLSGQLLGAGDRSTRSASGNDAAGGPRSRSSLLHSLALLPVDYGVLCAIFVLYGSEPAFAWTYGLLFAVNAAWLGLTLWRRYLEVVRRPAAP